MGESEVDQPLKVGGYVDLFLLFLSIYISCYKTLKYNSIDVYVLEHGGRLGEPS
jgi:hypothetical protein